MTITSYPITATLPVSHLPGEMAGGGKSPPDEEATHSRMHSTVPTVRIMRPNLGLAGTIGQTLKPNAKPHQKHYNAP